MKVELTKRQQQRLLKLSKEEIVEVVNETLNKYWMHRMDFFKEGLTHILDTKDMEKELKKIQKEQEDFEKASKEYQDFMNEMFDKYGSPLDLLKLNSKELAKFLTLKDKFKKEALRGIKNEKES